MPTKKEMVARNLQFDASSSNSKASKTTAKPRATRTRKTTNVDNYQPNINVVFQKLGTLSPKKRTTRANKSKRDVVIENKEPTICKTPTKSSPIKAMNLDEVKTRITTSSRLAELRARIAKFKSQEDKLEKLEDQLQEKRLQSKKNEGAIKIKEFERIELEIPVSPQKTPSKYHSPTKTIHLSPKASPARRLLFEPKEAPASPVKSSPVKVPAYQRYQSLVDTEGKAMPLPYKYRFLAEIFRSIDTVSAMLYNRKENITFAKLKPAVQELVRRNFGIEHLAQVIEQLYLQMLISMTNSLCAF